ncbi:hypothetical protein EIP86_009389 [Pleurotus ostreatoroseus]|nr:hypothetical protein EIP86_009389 [Pleurotus ostreatoroseus]
MSAVRNLNGVEVGGRPLRIDLADSDPFLEGKTTVRGELLDMSETRAQWREREREREHERRMASLQHLDDPKGFLATIPQGIPLPPGTKAEDLISSSLANMPPGQVMDVLAQMKAFVISHPEHARALLQGHPQLGYALFQALVLNNIVDPSVVERMRGATTQATAAPVASVAPPMPMGRPAYQPPPVQHPGPPPAFNPAMNMPPGPIPHHPTPPVPSAPSMYPPPAHMQPQAPHIPGQSPYYRPPPPAAPAAIPPPVQVPTPQPQAPPVSAPAWDSAQHNLLLQVLQLTQEQINTLPPAEREQINNLVCIAHLDPVN